MTKATNNESNDEAVIRFLDFVARMIAKRHLLHTNETDDVHPDPNSEVPNQKVEDSERI